jgi:hypothetical protein
MLAEVLDILLGALRFALLTVIVLFLPVIVQLLLLFWASRILDKFVATISGTLYTLLNLVGTPIHEFSHAVGFLLTFSGVVALKPLLEPGIDAFAAPRKPPPLPLRGVPALAPLFGGILVLWLTARYVLPGFQVPEVALPVLELEDAATLGQVVTSTLDYMLRYASAVLQGLGALQWTNWRTYLGLYFAVSVGIGTAPSPPDVKYFVAALPVTLFLLYALFVPVYLLGDLEGRFVAVQQLLVPPLLAFSTVVIYALLLTLFGIVLCVLLWFLQRFIWG